MNELQIELEKIKQEAEDKITRLVLIEKELLDKENKLKLVADDIAKNIGDVIVKDLFLNFFKKPYFLKKEGKNKVLVIVPKFIKDFQVGWLLYEKENYYVYQLDQYSSWLGDVPTELLNEIDFKKEIEATVEQDMIFYELGQKENIKAKLKHHIKDIEDTQARIIKGHEFDIIADMIKNGCIPYKPKPISETDRRKPIVKFELREYQKPAFEKFEQNGAVGLFYPTGSGKSFLAMACIDILKGKKLILAPSLSILEQWTHYIEKNLPEYKDEIELSTYQGYRVKDQEYILTIYDECHRLPANTFSRMAFIKTKYRLGLSASPFREDNRTDYVFALTGFPMGLNWKKYMETVKRSYHPIYVHIVKNNTSKIKKAWNIWNPDKKTIVFTHSIDLGKQLERKFNTTIFKGNSITVPFVYGETKNRLETLKNYNTSILSSVGDMGISISNLERIIEVDFLGGRSEALQRTGRLMHSEKAGRHDMIMTESEFQTQKKKIWTLEEKGFTVKLMS